MVKYLIHCIDKRLGVIPIKVLNHLNFVAVREHVCHQGYLLVRSARKFNQALPCRNAAACEKQVSPMCVVTELERTSQTRFAMDVGEAEVLDPNIVVSMSTSHPSNPSGPVVADVRHR